MSPDNEIKQDPRIEYEPAVQSPNHPMAYGKPSPMTVGPGSYGAKPYAETEKRRPLGDYLDELEVALEKCHEAFNSLESQLEAVLEPNMDGQAKEGVVMPGVPHSWAINNIIRKTHVAHSLHQKIRDILMRLET